MGGFIGTASFCAGNILLGKADSGFEKTSVINFSQILTIDKSYFKQIVSMLPKNVVAKMNLSLKIVFDLE